MRRSRLDPELKQQIKALTLAGKGQKEISGLLGIHRNRTFRFQRALGLRAHLPLPEETEKEILRLLHAGAGSSRIGRQLGCGEHQVRLVARKHRFQRSVGERGYKFHPTTAQFIRVMNEALARTDSAAAIARKLRLPYRPVLRIVHRVLQCEKFIGGQTRIALDSYLPQRWPDRPIKKSEAVQVQPNDETTAVLLRLVDTVCTKVLDGLLPAAGPAEEGFIKALCLIVIPEAGSPDLHGCEREAVKRYFETSLRETIGLLRELRAAQWAN